MAEDDAQLRYFSEALKARGMESELWKLEAFAEKKELGMNEADIIRGAEEGTKTFNAQAMGKRMLQGTGLGAIAVPVVAWFEEGRPSWRGVVSRGPKTVGLGALLGAGAGWLAGKVQNYRCEDAIGRHFEEFKRTTHEMEMAWTEALGRQAAEKEASVRQDSGPTR